MKKKFTFLVFLLFFFCGFQGIFSQNIKPFLNGRTYCRMAPSGVKIVNTDTVKENSTVIRFSCRATTFYPDPLFVVDGYIVERKDLANLDPGEIKNITVFKDSKATVLFGCQAVNGVILITTKHANQRTILVKDFKDGNPLPGATVEIISRERQKDTIRLAADSLGKVVTNEIVYGKEYELRVTSIGYKSHTVSVSSKQVGKNYPVLMERDIRNIDGVVVVATDCRKGCRLYCRVSGIIVRTGNNKRGESLQRLKIYPNPAQRSQTISINYNNIKTGRHTLKLIGFDGKLISLQKHEAYEGLNKISYPLDSRLAAGIYFLQLFDETNRIIKTERLIIQ